MSALSRGRSVGRAVPSALEALRHRGFDAGRMPDRYVNAVVAIDASAKSQDAAGARAGIYLAGARRYTTRVSCQVQYSPIVLCCMRFVNKSRKPFPLHDRTDATHTNHRHTATRHTRKLATDRNVQTREAYNDLFAGGRGEKQYGRHAVQAVHRAVPCGERVRKHRA